MTQPKTEDIKRKINSKIFDLQSSLLEEGVGDALLQECAIWFQPWHLQDIVVERSEAEGRCGWPCCGNSLPSWRLAAPLVFDVSDGEQLGRFCDRTCMTKTQLFLSAIPSTPPHSREKVLRLTCPSALEGLADDTGGGAAAGATGGHVQKKVYKRARRRDVPLPRPADAGKADEKQTDQPDQGVPDATIPVPFKISAKIPISERKGEHVAGPTTARDLAADGDGVDVVQTALAEISISEESCSSSAISPPLVQNGDATASAAVASPMTAAAPAAASPPAPAVPPSVSAARSDWQNLRFSRSNNASSTVARHATLAAAAAEAAAATVATSTATATATASVTTSAAGVLATSGSSVLRPDEATVASGDTAVESRVPTRRKSVSFADGTKEAPPSVLAPSSGNDVARAGGGVRGRRRGRGRGRGGAGRGGISLESRGKAKDATPKKRILGGVVERTPAVPAPMEAKVGGDAARGRGAGYAGLVEGHLPGIETDLSFRVLPRGYSGGDPYAGIGDGGDTGDGVEEAKRDGLGADGSFKEGERGKEDEGEEEEEEGEDGEKGEEDREGIEGDGQDSEDDADENDRAIWREEFGEEMPPEVAQGSLVDMEAIRDKEMREKFASSIACFALLWSALSEWATPETRAVCRAGRAAAVAATAAATEAAGGAKGGSPTEDDNVSVELPPHTAANTPTSHFPPADTHARKAGAVAEAIEAEARRLARHAKAKNAAGSSNSTGGGEGPTVSGALRHSGVSAMVNMHLAQAERTLRFTASSCVAGDERRVHAGGHAAPRKSVWSEAAAEIRPGAGPGVGVENEEHKAVASTATVLGKTTALWGSQADASARAAERASAWINSAPAYRDKEGHAADPGGGAECRRAVAAVIDTFDAGSASAAAKLSIAQWKVIPLVLLTALGLGGRGSGGYDSTAKSGYGGRLGGGLVDKEEVAGGAEACARLCGSESVVSAREFEMLVEVLLDT